MLKYLAALVVVFGLAFVVARQDQHAADQATQKTAEPYKTTVATNPNEQPPKENIENPTRDRPRWYVLCLYSLFRWPNGTTTWAIILTLMAIAEQTMQTSRAADATLESSRLMERSIILQFRPKLIVRKVFLRDGTMIPIVGVPDAYPWCIDYAIANTGGSRAVLRTHCFKFTPFEKGLPAKLPYEMQSFAEPVIIEPGEEKDFSVPIDDSLTRLFRTIGIMGEYHSNQSTGHAYFWGLAQYADANGIDRSVAVCRHYETRTGRFVSGEDRDYEYAD